MSARRHGDDELEHRHPQCRGVDEAPAGEHEVGEGPLAGVASRELVMHVLIIPNQNNSSSDQRPSLAFL